MNLFQYLPECIGGHEGFIRASLASLASDPAGHELTVFAHHEARHVVAELAPQSQLRLLDWRRNGGSAAGSFDPDAHDVLFCPQMGLDPPEPGIPAAAAVPDLIPQLVPEHFTPEELRERDEIIDATMARSDIVVTSSEFSRGAIVERYAIDRARVLVVVPGDVAAEFRRGPRPGAGALRERLRLPDRYVIFPANYWPHKNHAGAIAAIALLRAERPDLHLVLTGAANSCDAARVREMISGYGLERHVHMLPYQPTATLAEIMRGAQALLYPSFMEGFGIPILEAFHLGVPVVASAVGGAAELAGDAAVIVDPGSPRSIAAGVARVLDDEDLRAALRLRGRQRARAYSWKTDYPVLAAALDSIASGPPRAVQPIRA